MLSTCTIVAKPRIIDKDEWFFKGHHYCIDEYRCDIDCLSNSGIVSDLRHENIPCSIVDIKKNLERIEQQYYLFIGYAHTQKNHRYPVYYDLTDGQVYIGTAPSYYIYNWRNLATNPIEYRFEISDGEKDFFELEAQNVVLSTLKLKDKHEKLPCKILALLTVDAEDRYTKHAVPGRHTVENIGEYDYLLVVCGNRIVVTNRLELEAQAKEGRINLMLDYDGSLPRLTTVYLGYHPDPPKSKKLTYSEEEGLVYDYSNCTKMHAVGTLDCTPNAIHNSKNLRGWYTPSTYSHLPCYTHAWLGDSQYTYVKMMKGFAQDFLFNLRLIEFPNQIKDLGCIFNTYYYGVFCRPDSAYLNTVILPKSLETMPEGLCFIICRHIIVPEGITQVDLLQDIPKMCAKVEFKAPKTRLIYESGTTLGYREIYCSEETVKEIHRMIHGIADKGFRIAHTLPMLKRVNDKDIEEILTEVSAQRLLCGLGMVSR